MTAFAKKQIQKDLVSVNWEIRSLNSRYLDVNFRLPETFRELEPKLREIAKKYLNRGKIDCSLHYHSEDVLEDITISQQRLDKLNDATKQIKKIFGENVSVNAIDILKWDGVIQTIEKDTSELHKTILSLFETVLVELNEQRKIEGEKLGQFIEQRLTDIQKEIDKVCNKLPEILELERKRLLDRFNELNLELDKTRLEQEMVFIIQKADIAEELDRIQSHISEIKKILKKETEIGRRLDFFMQELNREANTLGSKSISDVTSHAAVELKVLIEQMREQVQNIE